MRCKLGDLAFINKSLRPANVGKVVTCVKYLGYFIDGEMMSEYSMAHTTDHYWMVEAAHKDLELLGGKGSTAYLPDLWLTPITPPEMDDDTDTETPYELADDLTEKLA